ncbi:MAG: dienelactone hydrolase [Alteromonadaceae bacterium]|jgi:dienelactone hydrolase
MNIQQFIFILLLVTLSFATPSSATTLQDIDHQEVNIWSQGVRLAGDIYKPKNLGADQKLPGLLLIPGWGGSKENLKKHYGPQFAELGFIVLAFDYKSWGQSDGPIVPSKPLPYSDEAAKIDINVTHVRKIVEPFSMLSDVRAALHYLGGEPQVMPNNLGIWGTSLGGGFAVIMAASDDRVKALVDQMGPVNYPHNLKQMPAAMARKMETATARGILPPFPSPAMAKNPALKGYPNWAAMKRFNPLSYADQIQVPTLIIDAENETLFDRKQNGLLLHDTIKERLESKYIAYPGGHYDLYKGDNQRASRQEAADWFVKYLKQVKLK